MRINFNWKIRIALTVCLMGQMICAESLSAVSNKGTYLVRWQPLANAEVPLDNAFDMDIQVLRASGHQVADVKLTVGWLMPMHNHGMNVNPELIKQGPGHWIARGVILFMPGEWQFTFSLGEKGSEESAASTVDLGEESVDPATRVTREDAGRYLSLFDYQNTASDTSNIYAHDAAAAQLGEKLFFDARLSGSGKVSCSSCHQPDKNWTDGRASAVGIGQTMRNTPSLWNVARRRWLFWDGRAATLWSQALIPIEAPTEMGGSRKAVARLLRTDPKLSELYGAAFGERSKRVAVDRTFVNAGKALAAFETTLTTLPSRFDQFLSCLNRGPVENCRQLRAGELSGLRLFAGRAGCVNCHHGRDLTDEEFHDILLPREGPGRSSAVRLVKTSRFGPSTKFSDDRNGTTVNLVRRTQPVAGMEYAFRTPSLRQVARTAPYMHNGIYKDLRQVLEHYSTLADAPVSETGGEKLIRPLCLSEQETADLLAFLRTLSSN